MPDTTVHHATFTLTRDLDAAPARRDGPRENRFESAAQGQRLRTSPAAPAATGSAMASAFAKLQGLKK